MLSLAPRSARLTDEHLLSFLLCALALYVLWLCVPLCDCVCGPLGPLHSLIWVWPLCVWPWAVSWSLLFLVS